MLEGSAGERLRGLFGAEATPEAAVATIVADVRDRGDAALEEWTRRIDGVSITTVRASQDSMAEAWEQTPPEVQQALREAARRVRGFHEDQVDHRRPGSAGIHLRSTPLRRVGAYVPGGTAAYPSTVLHTTIPAQVAGVDSIVVASPPTPEGMVHRDVLAAAHLLGLEEVLAMGGAQAVAALAHGTESIEPVDKIVGPGNLFVTLAKRAVFGAVGIDGMAGPSEVVVVASKGANSLWIAHDLVSQLEHDPLAWAVCITDSESLAALVEGHFTTIAERAVRAGIIDAAAGRHGFIVVCDGMEEALALCDDFAPEHLELHGDAAEALCERVRCAGAIFVGGMAPVPMGDYLAGPNHTLPTGGAARFAGPLTVMDFVRWSSVTRLTASALARLGPIACTLAEAEGLHGHTDSIRARLHPATPDSADE
ncbi:MAG: histidinol dehydrogenase [Candidatus Dormibacteria bacterium]